MMNPSFTRGEYWLLETVAELATPICWLDWEEMELALNKQGHGMKRSLLIETLHKLFSEGLIIAHKFSQMKDCFVLSPQQIDSALDERQLKKAHYYRLTEKGGEYWEAFASPNWNNYISGGYKLPDDSDIWIGDLVCMTKDFLEDYFRSLRFHDYEVFENSIQRDLLKPWEATYWKKLPMGHRIRFKCKDRKKNLDINIPDTINQEWYNNSWCHWR